MVMLPAIIIYNFGYDKFVYLLYRTICKINILRDTPRKLILNMHTICIYLLFRMPDKVVPKQRETDQRGLIVNEDDVIEYEPLYS